jgi:hypothetical protein
LCEATQNKCHRKTGQRDPRIGAWVGRVGERAALRFEYVGLIAVFTNYAFVESATIAAGLYIVDHLFFALSIAINTYFQKISDPQDIAATSSVSFTINHIAAPIQQISPCYTIPHCHLPSQSMTKRSSPLDRFAHDLAPGTLTWIGLRTKRRAQVATVDQAKAVASQGLQGDHRMSKTPGSGRQVTLISEEFIAQIAHFTGLGNIDPTLLRRNLVWRSTSGPPQEQ